MNFRSGLFALALIAAHSASAQSDVKSEGVQFYSEGVLCKAKLFTPSSFSASSQSPAVVVAPGARRTRDSIESQAAEIARKGIVALAIDYRGWGECGGFLYLGEPIRWDDRLRFTQMTATMRIRRQRVDPRAQVIDIRNAITYLQGTAGVDRARIGVWGVDLAGGHAIVTAASDARVKAIVAQTPLLAGKDETRAAFAPSSQQQATMIRLARTGAAPDSERAAKALNADEERLGLAEYKPYWYLDQIQPTTAVLFVVGASDQASATAASKLLKGPTSVVVAKDGGGADAAEWLGKQL